MVAEDGNWMVCAHLGRALRRLVCSRNRAGTIRWLSHFGFSIRAVDVQNIDYTHTHTHVFRAYCCIISKNKWTSLILQKTLPFRRTLKISTASQSQDWLK